LWAPVERCRPPVDEDAREGGTEKAGYRCEALLARNARTRAVPIIFYTVLSAESQAKDLKTMNLRRKRVGLPQVRFLQKSRDVSLLATEIEGCIEKLDS
jgi:hypothetical protein